MPFARSSPLAGYRPSRYGACRRMRLNCLRRLKRRRSLAPPLPAPPRLAVRLLLPFGAVVHLALRLRERAAHRAEGLHHIAVSAALRLGGLEIHLFRAAGRTLLQGSAVRTIDQGQAALLSSCSFPRTTDSTEARDARNGGAPAQSGRAPSSTCTEWSASCDWGRASARKQRACKSAGVAVAKRSGRRDIAGARKARAAGAGGSAQSTPCHASCHASDRAVACVTDK